jgi:hypothetical protein
MVIKCSLLTRPASGQVCGNRAGQKLIQLRAQHILLLRLGGKVRSPHDLRGLQGLQLQVTVRQQLQPCRLVDVLPFRPQCGDGIALAVQPLLQLLHLLGIVNGVVFD